MRGCRFGVCRAVRGIVLAGMLTICGVSAQAFEPPPGGKNFMTPSSVPNYFSNEAAPFSRGSRMAQPGADRFNTAPVAASGSHAAVAQPVLQTAVSAGRGAHRNTQARGRTARAKHASSRAAGRAPVRKAQGRPASTHRPAQAVSRNSTATKHRVASRPRAATYGTKHASRYSR